MPMFSWWSMRGVRLGGGWFRGRLGRWCGLGLAIALLASSCLAPSTPPAPRESPPAVSVPKAVSEPAITLSRPQAVPSVQMERIWQDLQALNFPRYTAADRDHARQYLQATLEAAGWATTTQAFPGGTNIVAKRPQARPQAKRVLLVAHYDTVTNSPGADDNASGVVVALEVARQLRSRPTDHQLEVVFFDQEEQGLVGSFAFAQQPENLANILGVLNLEMLGYACRTANCQQYPQGLPVTPPRDRGDFLAVVGDREHPYLLQAFQLATDPALPPLFTLPIPYKGALTPDILRSDHAPFWLNNVGAAMVTDTADFRNPHYHQPSDTVETLDPDFLAGTAQRVMFATAALLDSR